jgi:LPS O-antigen subunit length determinant protein (WzzB/FepE family)
MVKNSQINNEEIDLFKLILTVWKGKWKIAVAVIISIIATISYQSKQTKNFTATTDIKPINYFSFKKDYTLNVTTANYTDTLNDEVPKFKISTLLNSYVEILNEKKIFEVAMSESNFLDASQYSDEQEYNEAIIKLASSVKILTPLISKEGVGNVETSYHTIKFIHNDEKKWKNVLIHVDKLANQFVKKTLLDKYNKSYLSLQEERKYALEDVMVKINNDLIDYDRKTFDHLTYLREQSEIAKKLGIAKSTVEVQTFGNQNAYLSNIQTDSPFYLRGYEAIDKEIELTESRDNKKAFINGLFELEKKKRAIEQDKTIERSKLITNSALLSGDKDFSAASINVITTKFHYANNKKILGLAILIGLMVGVIFVIISDVFQHHRVISKKD